MAVVRHKAAIHSGHFMISDFEPDEQDEEEIVVPPSEEGSVTYSNLLRSQEAQEAIEANEVIAKPITNNLERLKHTSGNRIRVSLPESRDKEISLTALFKSMSIAYRQRLTSPRWNRFRGLKLRWKDKIRMNNVIWRCWHMQFMKNDPRSLCAFANPMEIDNHDKIEGTTLLEGKYWKRKLQTIQKEYNHWRKFFRSKNDEEHQEHPGQHSNVNQEDYDNNVWDSFLKSPNHHQLLEGTRDDVDIHSMLNDEGMIVDLLLNTFQESSMGNSELNSLFTATSSNGQTSNSNSMSISVPFPNPRDYYKTTTNADLLQPGLGPLQPNLEDMDLDLDWLTNIPAHSSHGKNIKNSVIEMDENKAMDELLSTVVTATTAPVAQVMTQQSGQVITQPSFAKQSLSQQQQVGQAVQQPILMAKQPLTEHPRRPITQPPMQIAQGTSQVITQPLMSEQHRHVMIKQPLAEQHPSGVLTQPPMQLAQQSHQVLTQPLMLQQQPPVGGGKQRSMVAVQQHPSPYFTKARSPKQRLLQQQQRQLYEDSSSNSNSELIQLLKLPKVENGHQNNFSASNGIPPPLATDYQQEMASIPLPRHYNADEHRRTVHINSEQNRRTSIKHGFEELRALIPSLKDVPASSHKISKAALLHKGGDYICQMKSECASLQSEAIQLKNHIEAMELNISTLQGLLPALSLGHSAGASGQICGKLRQKKAAEDVQNMTLAFNSHVQSSSAVNWKYWAFSRLMKPLFESYLEIVAGSVTHDEMSRSVGRWLEDKCSLIHLRQSAVTSLKAISVQTSILRDPRRMPLEAMELANQPQQHE